MFLLNSCKQLILSILLVAASLTINGQTQEDFNTKLSDVYTNAADKKKALAFEK